MKVRWLLHARRDLRPQRDFIAPERPSVAADFPVRATVSRLTAYPYYGRAAPWDPTKRLRELPVLRTPFIVVYKVDRDAEVVTILRVVYGAQRRGPE